MSKAILHFHGELASLAGGSRRDYPVERRASLKDVVEALGVPHTEVHALAVDGQPVSFAHILAPDEAVDVRPGVPPVSVTAPQALRDPLPGLRFLADANVGRLATYLRLLGVDVACHPELSDADVAELSVREGRVLLTRDRGLLRRKVVAWGRLVRANDPVEQARDVIGFFGLNRQDVQAGSGAPEGNGGLGDPGRMASCPLSRCVRCNVELESVPKTEVLHLLEPRTRLYYDQFSKCPACGRVYWAGSHHSRMLEMARRLISGPPDCT